MEQWLTEGVTEIAEEFGIEPKRATKTERALMVALAESRQETWTHKANADFATMSYAESWARVAELAAILEDVTKTEAVQLYIRLKTHEKHVKECQAGSCEYEFNALVKAGLASPILDKKKR